RRTHIHVLIGRKAQNKNFAKICKSVWHEAQNVAFKTDFYPKLVPDQYLLFTKMRPLKKILLY
ncbi:MAG: hypothetical protein Q4F84_09235, partial [Fibrobacter sp.]|nr:hypothetical protein [Fibrobacter sp.]